MQLGCNTVLFGGVDLETALAHVAWAGYRYVELAVIKGMCEHIVVESGAPARPTVAEVRRWLDDNGLTVTAIEAATTDATRLEAIFGLANALGVGIVNIGSGGTSGDEESTKHSIAHLA